MLDNFQNLFQWNALLYAFLVSLMGFIIFVSHSFSLNPYLRTKNNLALSLMLPLITMVITKSIATNFFLSLGMIGALSIIRYRTPVKSTYELTLLFALVTIGISSIVNIKYSIGLTILIVLIGFLVKAISSKFANSGFSEVNNTSTNSEIIIKTTHLFDDTILKDTKSYLISYEINYGSENREKIYIYRFSNFKEAENLTNSLKNKENIISVNVQNYN